MHIVAHIELTELGRRQSHLLHHEGESTLLRVRLRDGVGHTLAPVVNAHDDEVARFTAAGYQRCLHLQAKDFLAELLFIGDSEH